MADYTLQEALNDSIDRLANGQTIDDCLRAHPQYAAELQSLLTTGQSLSRGRASDTELRVIRGRVWSQIESELADWPADHADQPDRRGRSLWLFAAVVAVALFAGVFIVTLRRNQPQPADQPTATATSTSTSTATETTLPTDTSTPAATDTIAPTETPSPDVQPAALSANADDVGDDDDDNDNNDESAPASIPTTAPPPLTAISEDVAAARAAEIFPDFEIVEIELETYEDGRVVWDVTLENDRSVDIDATSGAVLFFGFEVNDDNTIDPSSLDQGNQQSPNETGSTNPEAGNFNDT
ncbi:MAG: PepSY domain-containing protein, partial [Chloroflexota bacterium]